MIPELADHLNRDAERLKNKQRAEIKSNSKKVIHFYNKNIYGTEHGYVVNPMDAALLTELIGKKTITSRDRFLIENLTDKTVIFEQVLPE